MIIRVCVHYCVFIIVMCILEHTHTEQTFRSYTKGQGLKTSPIAINANYQASDECFTGRGAPRLVVRLCYM